MHRTVDVRDLGITDFVDVHEMQRRLRDARIADGAPDTLLLTEHRPVVTLGRAHPEADLRVPASVLAARGIAIVQTERGGDITYHGPGQLVAYGIIDLRAWDMPLLDYVSGLEEAVIRVLTRWGIDGERHAGARGVWVGNRKVASLGIHVRRWVTMHGIALNVAQMEDFELINPCGLAGVEMTSMTREASATAARPLTMARVKAAFVRAFAEVFECDTVDAGVQAAGPGR
jgi:lipoate-protein ligase B